MDMENKIWYGMGAISILATGVFFLSGWDVGNISILKEFLSGVSHGLTNIFSVAGFLYVISWPLIALGFLLYLGIPKQSRKWLIEKVLGE